MSNEKDRTIKEMKNLFDDPKFMKKAWQSVGRAVLQSNAVKPAIKYDKDGNPTFDSMLASYTYEQLAEDCKKAGKEVTQIELIMACQANRALFDTSAAIFVRDTVGAKPTDESKIDATLSSPYEEMTDDELEALKRYRDQKALEENSASQLPEASQSLVDTDQITIDEVLNK